MGSAQTAKSSGAKRTMLNSLLFSAGQLNTPPQVPLLPTLGELQKRAEATAEAQAATDPVPEYPG